MATSSIKHSQLQLVLENGIDSKGNPVFKNKNFNNVKTDATADQLFTVANALGSLQQHSIMEIERNNARVIIAE
ncbi:DUF1659 domain-containing protein [Pontibacillus litoralis]|uniref:DUF1659 domain-containing protein n=1 Tax=Pontibacillus litoralis JSM 072002 TaxID=1385512 RepID=A0A0A5G6V8_9BACI|nr:DUF1659 domain-containing protein [Pontibacillus litoralis]KGX86903.1 hypothetical protein N784_03350 [Pontibacillus litoralis JSM 072002]